MNKLKANHHYISKNVYTSLSVESISIITRRKNEIFAISKNKEKHTIIMDGAGFSLFQQSNTHFIKISANTLININHVDEFILDTREVIVLDTQLKVSKSYLLHIKSMLQSMYPTKVIHNDLASGFKGVYFGRRNNLFPRIKDIIYLVRRGSYTTVIYGNGEQKQFYETLNYFEDFFKEENRFVRIRRNCIVNMDYISNFIKDSDRKVGKLLINSHEFPISRRLLPSFRKKYSKHQMQ